MKVPFLGVCSLLITLWVVNAPHYPVGKSINNTFRVSPKPSSIPTFSQALGNSIKSNEVVNVRQTHPIFTQAPDDITTLGDSIKSDEVVVERDAIVSDFVILLQLSVNNTITSYDCIEQTHCYTLLVDDQLVRNFWSRVVLYSPFWT